MHGGMAADEEVAEGVLPEVQLRTATLAAYLLLCPALRTYGKARSPATVFPPGLARAVKRLPAGRLKTDAGGGKKAVEAGRRFEKRRNF